MAAAFAAFASGGIYCEPDRDHQRHERCGQEAARPRRRLPPRDREEVRERAQLRARPRLGRHREDRRRRLGEDHRPAGLRRGRQDRHDVAQREHLVRRLHAGSGPRPSGSGIPEVASSPCRTSTINGNYIQYMFGASIAGLTWRKTMDSGHEGQGGRRVRRRPTATRSTASRSTCPSVIGRSPGDADGDPASRRGSRSASTRRRSRPTSPRAPSPSRTRRVRPRRTRTSRSRSPTARRSQPPEDPNAGHGRSGQRRNDDRNGDGKGNRPRQRERARQRLMPDASRASAPRTIARAVGGLAAGRSRCARLGQPRRGPLVRAA